MALCNEPANVQVETTTTTIFVSWEPGQANQTRWQVSISGSDYWEYQTEETSILIDAHEMFQPGESFSVVVTGYCEDGDGDVESETIQAAMQPLPSLTLNETTDYAERIVIDGDATGSSSMTQFVLTSEMLADMHFSTISELKFYSGQNGQPWGSNAQFLVYLKEVDFEDFDTYCGGDPYNWDDMSLFYTGRLSIVGGVMTIAAWDANRFHYRNGNLLVGIKQDYSGTNCQLAWYAAQQTYDASMYWSSSDGCTLCSPYSPKVTFTYEPDPYQPPTNLEALFVSPNEVYYSWTPRLGQTASEIQLCASPDFTGTVFTTTGDADCCTAEYTTALQPATTYYFRAKALFDDDLGVTHESEWSSTIEFAVPGICDAPTGLAASNVGPFSANLRWTGDADGYEVEYGRRVGEVLSTTWEQDFEIIASGNLPSGWSTITPLNVNSQKWRVVNATDNSMANGGRGAIFSAKQASAATDDYLFIPVRDLRGRLSFYAKCLNQTGPGTGVVAVYYTNKKTNPQPTDLTPIEAKTITGTYTEYVINLGHLQGGGYIAFRHYAASNANVYAICLDDIEMENYGPQYGAWVSGGITDWYGTTIEGLTPDNTYRARVRALCDGSYSGHSAWTNATVFSTVKNIEFYDPDVEAHCVAVWDTDGDGKLSYAEAAAVTSLGEVFKRKTDVDMFGELQYFTGLSAIGDYTFYNCTNLSGVSLPPQITSIGEYAFGYCESMTGITLPENVNTIDMCAFRGSGLYAIDLPNSVTSIGNLAFADCDNLEAVYLPATVINMDSNPFAYCANLEAILVSPANSVFDSRDNCNAIVHTETNKLVSGCKSTAIPETVTTIGHLAFGGSTGLIALTIPEAVTRIDDAAFCNCSNLANLTVMATTPPQLGLDVFDNVNTADCQAWTPCEAVDNYQAAEVWNAFTWNGLNCDIILPIQAYTNDNDGWHLIAPPIYVAPENVGNMLLETYDLYAFDGSEEGAEWRNYKNKENNGFDMLWPGTGYLYANSSDVELVFSGTAINSDMFGKALSRNDETKFGNWNLVGNPFLTEATVSVTDYYRIDPGTRSLMLSSGLVNAMEGIFVEANENLTNVDFTKATRGSRANAANEPPMVNIDLGDTEGRLFDRARLRLGEGHNVSKLDLLNDPNRLYFSIGGKDYAVAYTEAQGEMPLHFDAAHNGTYTLTVNAKNAGFDYLHLIDNLTGADIDLLALNREAVIAGEDPQSPAASYTFTARTTDYASRFRLVFASKQADSPSASEQTFAYFNGSVWVIDAPAGATVELVDMTGRTVKAATNVDAIATDALPKGVYLMRLIHGDDVKTQKVVVR